MQLSHRCPKCQGRKLARIKEFLVPDQECENQAYRFPVVTVEYRPPVTGFFASSIRATCGKFAAWVCLGCGYTEFYAYEMEKIAELAQKYPDHVQIIDAEKQGPFR